MDPKINAAIIKAIKHYFADQDFTEMNKASPNRKFTKKYFDELENEFVPKKDSKKLDKAIKEETGKDTKNGYKGR